MNNKRKLIYLAVTICFFISKSNSQIGINATGAAPAANAMLDISSTSKGLLIPRMSTIQRNELTATATEGLTVYDTDTKGYWFYNGTSWQSMSGGGGGGSSQWTTNGSNIYYNTGNVGIGQTNPGMPLNFASTLGNKISFYGNSGSHYGFGVQSGLFQMYSDAPQAHIAFGHGSSGSFTERMRVFNSGADGSLLNGRLLIRNGTADINNGGGVWLYKADNSALLAFMGTQNNQNVGFYGGPANGGWGFTYNGLNSRVGIGNSNPNAPLAFAATLEKKITLYPGATGDVGFSVGGNQLKIYTDNPNAQVSIGYDAAGVFNDRFSVKPNGALAINGNTGAAGQVLTSGGAGAPQWINKSDFIMPIVLAQTAAYPVPSNFNNYIPNSTANFTTTVPGKLIIWPTTQSIFACINPLDACTFVWQLKTYLDNSEVHTAFIQAQTQVTQPDYDHAVGPIILNVGPGLHSFKFHEVMVTIGGPFFVKVAAYAQFIPN